MSDDREDLEVDVTDVRPGRAPGSRNVDASFLGAIDSPAPGGSAAVPEADPARHDGLVFGGWLPNPTPRTLVRRRAFGIATIIATMVIALALILGSTPDPRMAVATLFHLATPASPPTPPPGQGTLVLDHWVPWGVMTIDGRTVEEARLITQTLFVHGRVLPRVDLPPGQHSLAFRAAQFPSLRCELAVPAGPHDTCPLVTSVAQPADGVRELDLGASLDHLSAGGRAALLAAAESALAAMSDARPATVMPGEWYRASDGSLVQARAPLLATFVYALSDNAARSLPDYAVACVSLCETAIGTDLNFGSWHLTAHALPRWSYRDASGSVLIREAPAGSQADDPYLDVEVPLHVLWNGQWTVSPAAPSGANPTCAIMLTELDVLFGIPIGAPLSSYAAPTSAQGCVNDTSGNFPGPPAYFLYQFGVIVAANPAAHQMQPGVPVGVAQQQALAARLVG